jgi:hypothetical protein
VPLIRPPAVETGAELASVKPWIDAAFICSVCSVIEDQVEACPEDDPAKSAEVLLSFDEKFLNRALGLQGGPGLGWTRWAWDVPDRRRPDRQLRAVSPIDAVFQHDQAPSSGKRNP